VVTDPSNGARPDRRARSPQWRDGKFHNRRPRVDGSIGKVMLEFFFGGSKDRRPKVTIPVVARAGADYRTPPASVLRVTWLGHSTSLLEIDGQRVLIDPVWSERASPVSFAGPKRFYPSPLPLDQLPSVDVVLLSHDHADHFDPATLTHLVKRGDRFVVPLGVGARLIALGAAERSIVELDWWESTDVGALTLTATPARHFSGRTLFDRDTTLWAGWVLAGPAHRVFYSGDTALDDELVEIGERFGPFDLTMIEIGAYDAMWADVHLGPEQAVRAHRLVRGEVMLAVHWGLFDLALHGWTEPVERALVAAAAEEVRLVTPRPGELLEPMLPRASTRWWPHVPWHTVAEKPVRSTGVQHLMAPNYLDQRSPDEKRAP
jgi:L-ascorbate metabolism protein UlaG (beta-lactamase superfamily)